MSNEQKTISPRIVVSMVLFVVVMPFLPLLISRRWDWWEAWVYGVVSVVGFGISRALAARKHPDLIAERSRYAEHGDTKRWDKILSPLVALGGGLILLVAGIEALFRPLTDFGIAVKIMALAIIVASYALGAYALIENRFFSGTVRIQKERGHQVVSSGPYRWVRHPGYAGAVLTYLATPFLLDSVWSFVPAVMIVAALALRTSLEDSTLQEELPGYREYAGQVRYRLIPGVW